MMYKIKPEYCPLWGDNATEDTLLTEDEIEMIARGWEKDVSDVIDQLEPYNFRAAVELMDDEIREELHSDDVERSEARFLWDYCKKHKEKYGVEFAI